MLLLVTEVLVPLSGHGFLVSPPCIQCAFCIETSAFDCTISHTDFADNSTLSKEAWQAFGIDINGTFLLENLTYSNGVVLDRMFNNMANTDFTGLTVSNKL